MSCFPSNLIQINMSLQSAELSQFPQVFELSHVAGQSQGFPKSQNDQ